MKAPSAGGLAEDQAGYLRGERRVLTLVLSLTIPLALVVLFSLPNLRLFSIPSGSMAPAVPAGSHVIMWRASYGYSRHSFDGFELPIQGRWPAWAPKRGDIVVFRLPRNLKLVYIKRVVGLPGDRIRMINGRLSINGQIVPREPGPRVPSPFGENGDVEVFVEQLPEGASYRIIETSGDSGQFDNTAEFVVPPGHLFVLGDNRDNSIDSRQPSLRNGVGFVPIELVIGRVVVTF